MRDTCLLISIIIPVYNVEKYLSKCIESVIDQTYSYLEIILVDDGSTDDSGKICDEYAARDARIVVIHQKNQGVAEARNTGMAIAQGDYLMFVDSDDWVELNICELLLCAIFTYNVKSAMCSYVREYPNRSFPKEIYKGDKVFGGSEVQRKLCGPIDEELMQPENIECFNSIWAKLYPRKFLKEVRIMDTKLLGTSEDLLFNLQAFGYIDSMVYINQPCYHYRKEINNSITKKFKADLEENWNNLYNIMEDIMKKSNLDEKCYGAFDNRIALNTLGLGLNCVNDSTNILEKCRRIKNILHNVRRKNALNKLDTSNMPLYWKMFYFCAKKDLCLLLCVLLHIIQFLKGRI